MDSLYSIGDIVRVRSDLHVDERVPMFDGTRSVIFTPKRAKLAGMEVKISRVYRDTGRYEVDYSGYLGIPWTDGMFEAPKDYEAPSESDILSLCSGKFQ